MSKKETVLIKLSYLVELPEEGINNVDGALDKIMTRVCHDEKITIDGMLYDLKWNSTSSHTLDIHNENCGRCANCGGWTTDREKPNDIPELSYGATVDDRLLCDECLPPDHHWSF